MDYNKLESELKIDTEQSAPLVSGIVSIMGALSEMSCVYQHTTIKMDAEERKRYTDTPMPGLTTMFLMQLIAGTMRHVGHGSDKLESDAKIIMFEEKLFKNVMQMFGMDLSFADFSRVLSTARHMAVKEGTYAVTIDILTVAALASGVSLPENFISMLSHDTNVIRDDFAFAMGPLLAGFILRSLGPSTVNSMVVDEDGEQQSISEHEMMQAIREDITAGSSEEDDKPKGNVKLN